MFIIKQSRGRFEFSTAGPSFRGQCNACRKQALRAARSSSPAAAAAAAAASSSAPVAPASSSTSAAAAATAAGPASTGPSPTVRLDQNQIGALRTQAASSSLENRTQLIARIDAIDAGRESALSTDVDHAADSRWFAVACPRCGAAGIVLVDSRRQSLANNNLRSLQINGDPRTHATRRLYVSYVVLRAIDEAVQGHRVSPEAEVRCVAASQQETGAASTGYQDAHQLLREVAIGNKYTYDCVEPSRRIPIMLCHGVVSHLEARYNNVDNRIEEAIAEPYVRLVRSILNGQFRREATDARTFRPLLWRRLCECCLEAIHTARATADEEQQSVLAMYEAVAKDFLHSPPPCVSEETSQLCAAMAGEFTAIR